MTEAVVNRYLGFGILISNRSVEVLGRDGRPLGKVATVREARNFIRGYRRAERQAST